MAAIMMETPLEDVTPQGTSAEIEGLDHEEEKKASEEAITFMSSIGKFCLYFGLLETVRLKVSTTWF